jgi:hypothetical protein
VKIFKERWEISNNWQLIIPFLGIAALIYSSFKLSKIILKNVHISFHLILSIVFYFTLLKFVLFIFKKLENIWKENFKWEMISIFLVFAITGTSSIYISKPFFILIGITKENLNPFAYWFLYTIIGLIFYQILLILIGWMFGQFKFFWNFEKKLLSKLGLKHFIN